MSTSTVPVLLYRHAHRDVSDRSLDNGLSEKGLRQRERLTHDFETRWATRALKWRVCSSPRVRCQETVARIASLLGREVEVVETLDEQRGWDEDAAAFAARVQAMADGRLPLLDAQALVLCSHGDWIPEFATRAFGIEIHLDKGGLIECEWDRARSGIQAWKWIRTLQAPGDSSG